MEKERKRERKKERKNAKEKAVEEKEEEEESLLAEQLSDTSRLDWSVFLDPPWTKPISAEDVSRLAKKSRLQILFLLKQSTNCSLSNASPPRLEKE